MADERDPRIFKRPAKPPREVRCSHGYHHHGGPHACDLQDHDEECPWWAIQDRSAQ
jgi:hypothetical protein